LPIDTASAGRLGTTPPGAGRSVNGHLSDATAGVELVDVEEPPAGVDPDGVWCFEELASTTPTTAATTTTAAAAPRIRPRLGFGREGRWLAGFGLCEGTQAR
jgi:hypothetical protein